MEWEYRVGAVSVYVASCQSTDNKKQQKKKTKKTKAAGSPASGMPSKWIESPGLKATWCTRWRVELSPLGCDEGRWSSADHVSTGRPAGGGAGGAAPRGGAGEGAARW